MALLFILKPLKPMLFQYYNQFQIEELHLTYSQILSPKYLLR